MKIKNGSSDTKLLASGGGDGTAIGVKFQSEIGAVFLTNLLAEVSLDRRLFLKETKALILRFETEAPIDDILVETDEGGFIAIQAKANLNSSKNIDSEFGKTIKQIARHYFACKQDTNVYGWDRTNDLNKDRFLIAVGEKTSGMIRHHLREGLNARRQTLIGEKAKFTKKQKEALSNFDCCLKKAWESITSDPFNDQVKKEISCLTVIISYDIEGSERAALIQLLKPLILDRTKPEIVLELLAGFSIDMMAARSSINNQFLRRFLSQKGISVDALEKFREDIKSLKKYSDKVQHILSRYESIENTENEMVKISRTCQKNLIESILNGSLLIIGEPGSGKSAAINVASRELKELGHDVVELAVDQLPVNSLEGLAYELAIDNSFVEVLNNWEGEKPGFVMIDALDATRGGSNEAVFRTLISNVILSNSRWRIVASIRVFDLKLGQQFQSLFKGEPPDKLLQDPLFPRVRHVKIPIWQKEEMQELLAKFPALKLALENVPERVRELATVPFNTKLFADLLSSGIESDEFVKIYTQAELLQLYWNCKISSLGEAGNVQLRKIVSVMVNERTLRVSKQKVIDHDPSILQALFQKGVLASIGNDRYLSFRHHILFDFVASKVYLDLDDIKSGKAIFYKKDALGLMLGPAFSFLLEELWLLDDSRDDFWKAAFFILGQDLYDPVIKSLISRLASELSQNYSDLEFLAKSIKEGNEKSKEVLKQIIGSLIVKLEDQQANSVSHWTKFLANIVEATDFVFWEMKNLSYLLIDRVNCQKDLENIGIAARALLNFSFSKNQMIPELIASSIELVAKTYSTDERASRRLLEKIFAESRFQEFGPIEVPALTENISSVAKTDIDFVVEIFRNVFRLEIQNDKPTPMGSSQILPLVSNTRQDFEMARYSLEVFFPSFLESYPEEATKALIHSIEGFFLRKHSELNGGKTVGIKTPSGNVTLKEDMSCYWAPDPYDNYNMDAMTLLKEFTDKLETLPANKCMQIVQMVISSNKLAIVWARLLMAAVKRTEILGDLLFPIACSEPFLVSPDTRKDSIDLLAKLYSKKTVEEKEAFENKVLKFDFSRFESPDQAKERFLLTIFNAIGTKLLVTDSAKSFLDKTEVREIQNERPVRVGSGWVEKEEKYWWLRECGVEVDSSENKNLIAAVEMAQQKIEISDGQGEFEIGFKEKIKRLEGLFFEIEKSFEKKLNEKLILFAEGVLGEEIEKLSASKELFDFSHRVSALKVTDWVVRLSESKSPQTEEHTEEKFETNPSWSSPATRISVAKSAFNLCLIENEIFQKLKPVIENTLVDSHPAVRMSAAISLGILGRLDLKWIWELGEKFIYREKNQAVLKFFVNSFLNQFLHHDPEKVELLTLKLLDKITKSDDKLNRGTMEALGRLITLLWASHGREKSKEVLLDWNKNFFDFFDGLSYSIFTLRDGLVLGYEDENSEDALVRARCFEIQLLLTKNCIGILKKLLQESKQVSNIQNCYKFIDGSLMQVFFASGAFNSNKDQKDGLSSISAKKKFLDDVEVFLKDVGAVGSPRTIYHLLQLLEFLLPANPSKVFEIMSASILLGGRERGFQFESLGANLTVKIVGIFLADHREIFEEKGNREKLVECLELFQSAGWPSSRRLLYRLPELLQ